MYIYILNIGELCCFPQNILPAEDSFITVHLHNLKFQEAHQLVVNYKLCGALQLTQVKVCPVSGTTERAGQPDSQIDR